MRPALRPERTARQPEPLGQADAALVLRGPGRDRLGDVLEPVKSPLPDCEPREIPPPVQRGLADEHLAPGGDVTKPGGDVDRSSEPISLVGDGGAAMDTDSDGRQ